MSATAAAREAKNRAATIAQLLLHHVPSRSDRSATAWANRVDPNHSWMLGTPRPLLCRPTLSKALLCMYVQIAVRTRACVIPNLQYARRRASNLECPCLLQASASGSSPVLGKLGRACGGVDMNNFLFPFSIQPVPCERAGQAGLDAATPLVNLGAPSPSLWSRVALGPGRHSVLPTPSLTKPSLQLDLVSSRLALILPTAWHPAGIPSCS